MNYEIIGKTGNSPKIAILCPIIETKQVQKYYYDYYLSAINTNIMICDLFIDSTKKKTSAAQIKEYLNDLIPNLLDSNIELLIVTQPEYFKTITKQAKTDATVGDILPTIVDGLYATYCPNYRRVFFDPDKIKAKIELSLNSVIRWLTGDTARIGQDIIKYAAYPKTNEEIIDWLQKLLDMDCDLTIDVEAFDLKHYDSGIGTITFCWSETEGVAFAVDYEENYNASKELQGFQHENKEVRAALKRFFMSYQRKAIYHNICFDVYILIYQLFMKDILDQEGLLYGLDIMLRNWDCTQLITYLATNSCAGNTLSLKAQAQEYAGNYAVEDIHDITKIRLKKLLEYNLVDGLSTWYTYNKNKPIMLADDQEDVYINLFRPAVVDVIQMQLTGMPINMDKVIKLDILLNKESTNLLTEMENTKIIESFVDFLREAYVIKKNKSYKKKVITIKDVHPGMIEFNPGSSTQLQTLLYSEDFLGLPVLDYTDTKLPATGADTLEKLVSHTKDKSVIKFLEILIEFKASAIIISTFLPAFMKAVRGSDGWYYLFGNFRLGGTASGRLSSNSPNLQNIPSAGSTAVKRRLAKLIKECFQAAPGWLWVGLDFDSLEDKISAVTTKDPEKIKVYSDGYDGHCLRAAAYFKKEMPDIELCPENEQSYKAIMGDKKIFFHSSEQITYQGNKFTGKELFEKLK